MSCPPPTPEACRQECAPPPPAPPCREKPIMRGLHWAQTKSIMYQALALAALGGTLFHFLVSVPRKAAYKDFYAKAECDIWAEEMAKKGLFQSVPKESMTDKKAKK